MPRTRSMRFQCGHPGCTEVALYEYQYRDEATRLHQNNGNGKYRCVRHSQPETVLSVEHPRIVHEMVSAQTVEGSAKCYWGHFGYAHGPGFQAFCDDFPVGTMLRITAEVVLPPKAEGDA